MITPLDITHRETAQQVLDLQLPSYRVEAELTGFDGIPPLRDTVDTLISCGETFRGLYLDGELAGAISYKLEKNLLDIHRVMVHPRHFRKGVATALLQSLLDSTSEAHRVEVSTGSLNHPAKKLYRRLGFTEVGEEEAAPGFWMTRFQLIREGGAG
ncbi:GNAT family N-acetyltransferase [Kroppenstedtia eburnea]|uniref:Acetyltransferase (GNAT) domain-containing protein n=1 Tax=Kroppenstedtia eburnea TaxID=714067 RepID=A0A1N7KXX1_9BACL|nr:GNAT family N-acetyltransferase [Kroppenstedtia eburnea]QKI82758.1 GNAT family N-acetyltransferase [Kroppenstedtia eburnea]SIS66414.1 Acetyltransferase (GNAT) domain-containing protein [Kroppenstedtia eburnea]